jgi:hypothetical protein
MRRPELSYANVMATVAVFLALGGGAWAAVNLPKGSVGAKQLKKKAVKTKKLANGAVTDKKVRPNSLTGKAINESSLGTVPIAANSNRVGGSEVRQINYRATSGTQTLFSIAGLTVTAACTPPDDFVTLTVSSSVNDSIFGVGPVIVGGGGGPIFPGVENDFDNGDSETLPIDDTATVLSFGSGPNATPVVTANFLANAHLATGICSVVGTVVTNG